MKFTVNFMSYCEKMKASLPLYMSERGANTESEANECVNTHRKKKITLAVSRQKNGRVGEGKKTQTGMSLRFFLPPTSWLLTPATQN